VVDDNRDAADTLAVFLRLSGYEARVAYDGAEALAFAAEAPPDCVVMDLNMPVMNGCEAARRLRGLPWAPGVALVCLTAFSDEGSRGEVERAGFDYHLVKPAAPEEVVRILEAVRAAPG
jgi:CheY-like chemotaxis protein